MEVLRKAYFFLLDILQTLILAAAAFEVKGESMYPNLHDSEYLITNLIGLKLSDPKLGDVIVFKAPNEVERDFIKRVIGIAGDRISVRDGQVYLNQEQLDESKYLKPSVKT